MKLDDLFIIIVLYKTNIEQSETITSLLKHTNIRINILLFDNSPKRQYEGNEIFYEHLNFKYVHDKSNPGLGGAYNYAVEQAKQEKYKWILLLDQDTTLTKEYIESLVNIETDNLPDNIAAIIPNVVSIDNIKISPRVMRLGGFTKPVNFEEGIIDIPITGINSGTVLKIDYIISIGGFNRSYTLDMLDHWYFRQIYKDGFKCYLLSSSIYQDLSVLKTLEESISIERYNQMLIAERKFISAQSITGRFIFKLRLVNRIFKQIRFKDKRFYKLTLRHTFGIN